jgi:hypothetical protein
MRVSAKFAGGLGKGIAFFGIALVTSAWLLLGYQVVRWIVGAHWLAIDLAAALHWFGVTVAPLRWPGAGEILDSLLGWPLAGALLLAGAFAIWSGVALITAAERTVTHEKRGHHA